MASDRLLNVEISTMDNQYEEAVAATLVSPDASRRFQDSVAEVFRDVPLQGAHVLDIGGGSGLHSLYAAANGAVEVVCLEPGADGSRAEYIDPTVPSDQSLKSSPVRFLPLTLQDFEPNTTRFNVILLHNSVNHLDEPACMKLPKDSDSLASYKRLFEKLIELASDGALVIVTDCSSKNFFGLLQIRNPFAPTIEWEKHQQPLVWTNLLESVGFIDPEVHWLVPQRLGRLGQTFLGNRICAYFLSSYFKLTVRKPLSKAI